MTQPYLPLAALGIERVILHRIRAFCPTIQALTKLKEQCTQEIRPEIRNYTITPLHERPIFDGREWKPPTEGFKPLFTVGPSTASFVSGPSAAGTPFRGARLLRQGIGVLTDAQVISSEADLVESQPANVEEAHEMRVEEFLDEFATKLGVTPDPMLEVFQQKVRAIEQTAFEVVEMQFQSKKHLAQLEQDSKGTDQDTAKLKRAIAYFLARSYDVGVGAGETPSLERVVNELRPVVLKTLVQIDDRGGVHPVNLSQSERGFIILGPRGAVVAFAQDNDHPALRVSALNMIEILRGRHFNLIIARTYADDAIRKVNELCEKGVEKLNAEALQKEIHNSIELIMKANARYGLVVSDPGAFLLDGSTLTRMAENAEEWFHLRSLRNDTERKMEALERLWRNFQDQRRIDVIHNLSAAFAGKPAATAK